jgi:hypothetical protein
LLTLERSVTFRREIYKSDMFNAIFKVFDRLSLIVAICNC